VLVQAAAAGRAADMKLPPDLAAPEPPQLQAEDQVGLQLLAAPCPTCRLLLVQMLTMLMRCFVASVVVDAVRREVGG